MSLNPVSESSYTLPQKPPDKRREQPAQTSREIEQFYKVKETESAFLQEKSAQLQRLKQRLKRSIKSENSCEQELKMGRQWKQKQHEAELLQAHFYLLKHGHKQIELFDWEKGETILLTLDPTKAPKEEVARRFKKSKKLRLSIEPLHKQLQILKEERIELEKELGRVEQAKALEELPKAAPPKVTEPSLPYREFMTETGFKIWVGKNAKANEKMTFSYARGSDWWLHVHNFPGAHVVLRLKQQKEPDPESLQDAIQVALAYSSAKDKGLAEVCVTQVKYILRLKSGKPGQVQLSKHKLIEARFDPERFRQIKER